MTHLAHPKYRPDIDGMRAIAIAMVVLFHAFPAMLPGGFTGVDIFFVISGYLISTIIVTNLQQHTFSLIEFYARRIKRIFPALLLMITVTLLFGWYILFPEEWRDLGKNAFNGLLFISNFTLIRRVGYFDDSMVKNPLLHLWSLCVEEQYYLFWPLTMAFIYKRNRRVLSLIVACMGLSFLANILLVYIKPVADFYLPVTRVWELLAGSLLAWVTLRQGSISNYLSNRFDFSLHLVNNILSFYGIAMIAAGAFMIQDGNMFPGFWALLPVIGTFLLIDAGMNAWFNRFILGNKVMTAIGLISYPLYLWHWPLLAFARIVSPDPLTTIQLLKLIGIAVLLAALTYLLLEKPLRRTQKIANKTRALLIAAVVVLLASCLGYFQLVPTHLQIGSHAAVFDKKNDWEYPGDFNFREKGDFHFLVSNKTGKGSVLVIGDSHAEQYWTRLQKNIARDAVHSPALIFATYGGCPPLIDMDRIKETEYCDNFYHFTMDFAKKNPVSTVVFAAYWEDYFGLAYTGQSTHTFTGENRKKLQIAMTEFQQDITELRQQGKKVFIVLSNPSAGIFDPRNMMNRFNSKLHQTPLDKQAWLDIVDPVRQALQDVATNTGAIMIDPLPAICPENTCAVIDENNMPVYKDGDHLSKSFVLKKADFIDPVLQP